MNVKLPLFIACVVGGVLLGNQFSHAGVFPFSEVFPSVETSFDDLDVRDENNRPVNNVSAVRELQGLFIENLSALLVTAEIHAAADVQSILRQARRPFSFARAIPSVADDLIRIFPPNTRKRTGMPVLPALFCAALVAAFFLRNTPSAALPNAVPRPSVLRC